jgi:G:T/U-mismatch repair DNA glycosylase
MLTHPFKPQISKATKKLLIGTLPPENVPFYFSNSTNTRLWDILSAIKENKNHVGSGGNNLSNVEKIEILEKLKIGITDIIYGYERDEPSTKDKHIDPKEYNDLLQLALDNNIDEMFFVYQSALKWFIHSLKKTEPVRLKKLKGKYIIGRQPEILAQEKIIKCTLLPPPLNRGTKGQTLDFKLGFYRKHILGE